MCSRPGKFDLASTRPCNLFLSTPRDAGCVEGGAFVCMVLGEHMVRGMSVRGNAAQTCVQAHFIRMRIEPIGMVAVAAQVPKVRAIPLFRPAMPVHYSLRT